LDSCCNMLRKAGRSSRASNNGQLRMGI